MAWFRARTCYGLKELVERLTAMGLQESERSITVKINRGAFPAWFLIAAMEAMEATVLRLD